MRKIRNRHVIRKKRKHEKKTYVKSANIIQSFFREHLKTRYEGECINFDDDDIFTFEPVHMIPRELLIIVEGHGFNSLNLLLWIMRKSNQVHPITRNKFDESVEVLSVYKIACFLRNDSKKFKHKNGYYKRRKLSTKVLTKYTNKCFD